MGTIKCKNVFFTLILIGLSSLAISVDGYYLWYDWDDMGALQALYNDWAQSTPDPESNLAGWKPNQLYNYTNYPCFSESWRGILCHKRVVNQTTGDMDAWIVGLELSDASIVGTLPAAIGNFTNLISLTLTGNPNLTGFLPDELGNLGTLYILDLHGNGFSGSLPTTLTKLNLLQELDLSGNQLTGDLPMTFSAMAWLRTLKISQNLLSGPLQQQMLQGLNQLVEVDLSSNDLTGMLPNLTTTQFLHKLNLSMNHLNGMVDPTTSFSSNVSKYMADLDLSKNNFTGPIPNLGSWLALESLDLSYNNFDSGPIPEWLTSLNATLQVLINDGPKQKGLSGTSLIGDFPLSVLNTFTKLKVLNLDDNHISGSFHIENISSALLALSKSNGNVNSTNSSGTLQLLSLANNDITDVTYNGSSVKNLPTVFRFQGNPFCSNSTPASDLKRCICEQFCSDTDHLFGRQSSTNVIIIATTICGFFLGLSIFVISVLYARYKRKNQYLLLAFNEKFAAYELKPTIFSYEELEKATHNFHEDGKLGQGAYGVVYKEPKRKWFISDLWPLNDLSRGILPDGTQVAVKQLFEHTSQNIDDFLNEVVVLTSVKHRNLVKLKGCCLRGDRRLLVYEYVENPDLGAILFDYRIQQILSWPTRLNICKGIAHGLHYLHAMIEPKIIHRDIKANNILLDRNLQPKIADFGLALLFSDGKTHTMTINVAGTRGYVAPEYATLGQLSEKVDVYSYGVLVLEIVSGRRNIDPNMSSENQFIAEWVRILTLYIFRTIYTLKFSKTWRLYNQGRLTNLIDPRLSLQNDEELEVQRVIHVALLCLDTSPERRPIMAQVAAMLDGDMEVIPFNHTLRENSPLYSPQYGSGSSKNNHSRVHDYRSSSPLFGGRSQSNRMILSTDGTIQLSELQGR